MGTMKRSGMRRLVRTGVATNARLNCVGRRLLCYVLNRRIEIKLSQDVHSFR
jgi:hypothetical protein